MFAQTCPCSSEPAPLGAGTPAAQHPWLSDSLGTRAPQPPQERGFPLPATESCHKEPAGSCNACGAADRGAQRAQEEVNGAALEFCNPSVAMAAPARAR